MSKRVKIIILAVVAVLLLSIGFTTLVSAQEPLEEEINTAQESSEADTCKGPFQNYISDVADILEIEEEELINACNQARQQTVDEALEKWLDRAVEDECIDEQEASEIREWWQNRPKDALQDAGKCARLHIRAARCHRLMQCCPCQ